MAPAILLAAVGLYSLRKDRALAQLDARDAAREAAEEMAEATVPAALNEIMGRLGFQRPVADKHEFLLNALIDDATVLTCEIDDSGELVFPPPYDEAFDHSPLNFAELPNEGRILWDRANSARMIGRNDRASVGLFDQFIETKPPRRFEGMANARVAAALVRLGWFEEARITLERVLRDYADVKGETGMSLEWFAELHLLRLDVGEFIERGDKEGMRKRAEELAKQAIEQPSHWTDWHLFSIQQAEWDYSDATGGRGGQFDRVRSPGVFQWRRYWEAQLDARRLYHLYREQTWQDEIPGRAVWLEFQPGQFWLARTVKAAQGVTWLVAQQAEHLEGPLREAVQRFRGRDDFAIGVDFAGRTIVPMGETKPNGVIARVESAAIPGLSVEAVLGEPKAFFEMQEARLRQFGALIAFSVAAVLVGFVAAWRSFQKQIRLSEMKSNFVSSVSHELRTPIASVSLMAEELRDLGADDPAQSREYHEFIVKECRRLTSLIENILDYSRIERGAKQYDFESTDMTTLVEQTVKSLDAYAHEHGIELETMVTGEAVSVQADARAIQGSLVNLIDNAIKHAPADSAVTVGLDYQGDEVRLRVRDRGPGIPAVDRERVFERFFRRGSELRRETKGTGLGLAIVKHAVDGHHGRIQVTGEEGEGSCFEITLPVKTELADDMSGAD